MKCVTPPTHIHTPHTHTHTYTHTQHREEMSNTTHSRTHTKHRDEMCNTTHSHTHTPNTHTHTHTCTHTQKAQAFRLLRQAAGALHLMRSVLLPATGVWVSATCRLVALVAICLAALVPTYLVDSKCVGFCSLPSSSACSYLFGSARTHWSG